MLNNTIALLSISTLFAAIPGGIWLWILFSKGEKSKKVVSLVFFVGCFTAPALLGLQYLWDKFPNFNLATLIETSIQSQNAMYIAMFVLFGMLEEVIKMYVIVLIDKKTLLIKTVNNAILYSLASALGFSFIENIYYLYEFWPSISTGALVGMYIFRSIFTTCAHLIFSGIFGYYYGISKFSIYINKEQEISGKTSKSAKIISKIFNLPMSQAYQQQMVIKGLFLAVSIHATYNYLLQFNKILPVIIFVILGALFLQYLLKRKSGHLVLASDISDQKKSSLAKKDEEVVIELLGMWFNEKRYVDVIHICERLLERDPDNNVVKLFKTQAMDKLDDKDTYKNILKNVIKTKDQLSTDDKNLLTKYIAQKETIKKDHSAPQTITKLDNEETLVNAPPKQILEDITKGDTFNLK